MKTNLPISSILVLLLSAQHLPAQSIKDTKQQYVSIGDFTLESNQKIYDCTIGYRTYGKLNAGKSNVIIFPTWFTGTTKNLEDIVPGKLVDTTAFYLILIDALGDGYSSSPDNSTRQPRLSFPRFTIRDMVESQYQMLTETMSIHHLYAVAGISMGGMQSFQWAVSHPDFMDKVVPVVGSPQLSSNDLLLWNGELEAIQRDAAYKDGNYKGHPVLGAVSIMHHLALTTPEYQSNAVSRDSFNTWLAKTKASDEFDWNNWRRQLEAMISHDIAKTMNGSLEETAKSIRAKFLIIVSKQDHMVNPMPAAKLAALLNAKLLTLESDCGHIATLCELEKVITAMHDFLSQ